MLYTSLLLLFLVVAPSTLAQSPPCALGAYNNNGVCSSCPAGKVCLGGYYAQPTNCGTGKVAMTDGYSCIWDGTTGCSAGTYALAAVARFVGSPFDNLCVACPTFTVCTGGLSQPTACPAGQTPNTNISATSCITTTSTSCPPGWYVYNGACWICPDLHYCTGGSALPTKCSPGLYPADALGRDQDQRVPVFGASTCIRPSYCLDNEFPNATGCWPCEPGFTCNGGQWNPIAIPNYAPPTSCPAYNYLNGDRCMGCSANFNCPGGTALPQAHPSGTYSSNIDWKYYMGTQILFPYQPASNAFNGLRALPLSCPVGQYLNTDPRAGCASSAALYTCTPLGCLACPAGFSCAGGLSAPVACANGLVTNWNSTLGPIGSFCVQPDVPCPAGYVSTLVYSYPGFGYIKKPGYLSYSGIDSNPLRNVNPSIKCMTCTFSLGSICPGGFIPQVDCQSGYSTDPMDLTKCIPTPLTCPPGYGSSTNGGQTYPGGNAHCNSFAGSDRISLGGNIPVWGSQCPSGSYPNENNTICVSSSSVSSCDSGQYLSRINFVGRCLPCPAGYGCPGGYVTILDKFAVRCGLGKAPAANASTCLWDGVTSCSPGQWGTDGSRFDMPYCNPCPSGAMCAGGSALPVGCPSGQGPNPTSTACSVQTTCNAGYYLSNGRCSLCIVGHTCAGGTASPVLCPTRLVPLDAAGKPATVGYSMLTTLGGGVNNAYDISIQGGFPAVSCGIPPSCPPGTYMNTTTGFEGCTSCPSGFACPGEYLVPVACTGSNIGLPPSAPTSCGLLSSVNAPYSCSIGYYVPSGGKYCEPCTPGVGCGQPCNQWSVFLDGQCTYVGTARTTCNPGKYLDTSYSLAVCIDCPVNSMCTGGTASYITCPAGQFSDSTKTKCVLPTETSCPVGWSAFWRLESATFPSGYLWTWGGLSKVTPLCEVCPSRISCPGGYAPPRVCPDNAVPDLTTSLCRPMDTTCPVGYTLKSLGYGSWSGILFDSTFLGDWSNNNIAGPSISPTRCEKCDENTLCPAGTTGNPPLSSTCNTGFQPNQLNSACVSTPSNCLAGQYPLYGVCAACRSGSYCLGGGASPVACGSSKVPNSGATACVWDGTTVCAAGSYVNPSTTSSDNYCVACTAGNACAGGTAAPTACPAGQIVNSAASACTACPSGYVCLGSGSPAVVCGTGKAPNSGATACVWDGTTVCAAGTYINTLTSYNAAYCTSSCPSGSACAGGTAAPVACIVGQIVNSGASACAACPSGFYCPGGASAAVACGTGKTPNSGATACVWDGTTVCAAGTYINTVTTYDAVYCANCTAGKVCYGGTAAPALCTAGEYVNSGATACFTPTSCNVGDFVNATGCFPCPSGSACAGGVVAPVACGAGQIVSLNMTMCVAAATTCSWGDFLYQGICRTCPIVSGITIYCPGGSGGLSCGPNINLVTTCAPCPANANCYNTPISCNSGYMYNAQGTGCIPIPPGPCESGSGQYFNTTISGISLCAPCPTGKVCFGKGSAPVSCPPSSVPHRLTAAAYCVAPATSCSGSSTLINGICVNPSTVSYGTDCTGSPSNALISRCAFGISEGGAGASASIFCGNGVLNSEWRCRVSITNSNCGNNWPVNNLVLENARRAICAGGSQCDFNTNIGSADGDGLTSCPCPGNATCSGNFRTCNSGFMLNSNGITCNQIPASCPAGQGPVNGVCTTCPSGYACPSGTLNGYAIIPSLCGTSKIPNAGATACVWDGTTVCAAGAYLNPLTSFSDNYCLPCPSASACAGGSAAPALCAAGEYVNSGASACFIPTSCNVGDYLVGSTGCFPCPSGSACAGGVVAAVACGAGQTVSLNMTTCVAAATTCSYGNFLYQGNCRTCPVVSGLSIACYGGSSGLNCGANLNLGTTCGPCPAFASCYSSPFSCNSGYMYNAQGTGCIPVPPGPCEGRQYLNTTISGFPVCAPCPAGFVCVGQGAAPTRCPSPTVPDSLVAAQYCYNPATSCTGSNTLINGICVNPTYNMLGSACTGSPSNALISRCAFGVSEGGAGASASIYCGNGALNSEWRCRVSITNINCASNWAVDYPALDKAQRAVCGYGSQCDFTTNIGTTDGDGLSSCPCPGNATCTGSVRTCNTGFMLNSNGITCNQLPASCPAGQGPVNGVCTTCPSGYACPSGTLNGYAIIPSLCGTSKVPNSGATACVWDGTTVCAAGAYLNPLTSFSDNYCLPCPSGRACAGGTAAPVACIVGQIVNSGASACAACPSGLYCPGGASAAVACGTGKVPNSGATACVWDGTTVCAAGTYINTVTTYTAVYCANCTAGKVCYGGSAAPALCAAGEYVNSGATACFIPTSCNVGDYLVGSTGCFPCPSGSACAGGVAAAVACGAGQLPNVAKSACVASASTCTSGNFLFKVNSSETSGICLSCPSVPGVWLNCPGGTAGLSCWDHINFGYTCKQCPVANAKGYCSSNNIFCRSGTGQVPEYMISDSGNDCIEIPAGICREGSYENTTIGGITVCDECPRGKFCPGKGAGARTCPPSQYPNQMLVPSAILGATRCINPVTTCSSGQILINGICVGNGFQNPVSSGGTTPSAALVTKCQAAVQAAITGGGALAFAFFEFIAYGGSTKEWRCRLTVPGTCFSQPYPSYSGPIAASLCGNVGAGCNSNTNVGFLDVSGNGVSGGSCQSSGGGGGGCSGNPPTTGCSSPSFWTCSGTTYTCFNPSSGGGGPSCSINSATAPCTTPGNTLQCLTGSSTYTCAPAAACSGPAAALSSNTFCSGSPPVCGSNGKWGCRTCSNTNSDVTLTCQGESYGPCASECTDWICGKHQTCTTGKYLNYPQPPQSTTPGQAPSSGFIGTCLSPAAGSTSCPSGQFLVASPVLMTGQPSSTNVPPALSLQCAPCPAGYTCAGGTGATAYATPSTSGASACPAAGSGLSSVLGGYSGGVTFSIYSTSVLATGTATTSTNLCIIQTGQVAPIFGYYLLHPFVGCDPNFMALTPYLGITFRTYCIPCPSGSYSPGGYIRRCSACPGTPPAYGSCPVGQTLKCSGGSWSCQAATTCAASGGPSGPAACSAGSTWSPSGTAPCAACTTCSGTNQIVSTTCSVTSDAVCGCDSGSTKDAAGTGCLPTAVVVMPYSISSPTLCSAAGVVDSVLKPTSGVALSLRGNLSVALGIPSSSAFIVAVTACDSTTTLVAQNAPINTAIVPGGIPGRRRLQTAALNTSSLNLVIDGQTLVITLGFTIPTSVAPAMSAFLSASMSGTATPATMATLASNLQQSIQSSGAASSPQLSALLVDISAPSSSSSSSNAANAFSKRLNSVPVSAAAPMAASLGVSVASLGITNNTVKGIPSAIAVTGNPLAVSPTPTKTTDSGNGGLGGLGALVLLVILPACGYYFFVYRKKKQQGEAEKKKEGSDVDGGAAPSSSTSVSTSDISFDIVSPMHPGNKNATFDVVSPMRAAGGEKKEHKASFEPKSVDDANKSTADSTSV